jgi:pyroglutamyl-peptidase
MSKQIPNILLTGFGPYGGMSSNPAYAAMRALDGEPIAGHRVVGRPLPVSITRIGTAIDDLLHETRPQMVISLGLAPGEPVIRLERVGLNLADFELGDNEGLTSRDQPVSRQGSAARWASLPLRRIEAALLANGIPARLSETAGTYLCNACLYNFLERLESQGVPCGFIHVPMTPDLAAEAIARRRHDGMDRLPPPSMSLDLIITAVRIAIAETVGEVATA